MSILVEVLINKYFWIGLSIIFTLFALWITFQATLMNMPLSKPIQLLWIIVGLLWLFVLVRDFYEYILTNITAQIIIFVMVVMYLWFVPSKNKIKKVKSK